METLDIQDILNLVEQPSRYLGNEVNAIRKAPEAVRLRIALAFPDLYEIGISHFGIQILYHMLNREPDIAAERVYAPAPDMEALLRSSGQPVTSLESQIPLNRFDIIGFSLLYELNYTGILTLLDLAGIPFYASERDETHPFIIAGGPCTCNPEPVADFFDAVVVGDGEPVIPEMTRAWKAWRESGADKAALLKTWSEIEGVYIPSFFSVRPDETGSRILLPENPAYSTVRRAVAPDLDRAPFPDAPIVPFGRPVHDRLRLEVARGCTRGCRFCQAGMIYRPVRERSPEALIRQAEDALAATGYDEISLLSLSTGDYSALSPFMHRLMDRCAGDHVAVSLPSFRAGTLSPELMEAIRRVRKTGFTIAPEAATDRLRAVINKNITRDDIFQTVQNAFSAGWQVIKLYFMIGLPTETDADVEGIADLTHELRRLMKGKRQKIHVSVGTFIPKPHTPFQWSAQMPPEEAREKLDELRGRFRGKWVQYKWQHPEVSCLEGVWSRGDRRLSRLLEAAWRKGCRLDGWSDRFRYDLWREAMDETGISPEDYISRPKDPDAPLPWDHIDIGVSGDFLKQEWKNALAETATGDCRYGDCRQCGVCDFDAVMPKTARMPGEVSPPPPPPRSGGEASESPGQTEADRITYQVDFSKTGPARLFGHLEMVNIFIRAIRRAEIPVAYSGGFHPMPKIAFDDPLPIGMESLKESFYMTLNEAVRPLEIPAILNDGLPEGLRVAGCSLAPGRKGRKKPEAAAYRVELKEGVFEADRLRSFREASALPYERTRRKGKTAAVDLKDRVIELRRESPRQLFLKLRNTSGPVIRPAEILRAVFGLTDQAVRRAHVSKIQ